MSTTIATDRMTIAEFYEFCNRPENREKRFELDEGEVVEMPRPGALHGVVCALLARILLDYLFQKKRGYLCTNDTGLIVSVEKSTLRGPDLLLFVDSPVDFQPPSGWLETVPQLVVEVLSPNDRYHQIEKRIADYLRLGIPLIWIIDPEMRAISVHRPNELSKILDETDELTGNGVLPDFHCKVADLFRLPGQG